MPNQPSGQLKSSIGLWIAVAINLGTIIGGGIFVVTGIVAGHAARAVSAQLRTLARFGQL